VIIIRSNFKGNTVYMDFKSFLEMIGLIGIVIGFEVLGSTIFYLLIPFVQNPDIAAVIGSISCILMTLGLIDYFLRKG
jgi:hypothetical protein